VHTKKLTYISQRNIYYDNIRSFFFDLAPQSAVNVPISSNFSTLYAASALERTSDSRASAHIQIVPSNRRRNCVAPFAPRPFRSFREVAEQSGNRANAVVIAMIFRSTATTAANSTSVVGNRPKLLFCVVGPTRQQARPLVTRR